MVVGEIVGWRIGIVEAGLGLGLETLDDVNLLDIGEDGAEGDRVPPTIVSPLKPLSLCLLPAFFSLALTVSR